MTVAEAEGTVTTSSAAVSATQRAAVLSAPGVAEVLNVARPEPAAHQLRIRVEGSGMCASTIPSWEGREWFNYPLEAGSPGHEGWGVIDAIGDGVNDGDLRVGQRVAFLSGQAYAEYELTTPDAVVALPRELDGQPFPGEAIGCAMNAFRRSDIRPGDTVGIVGIGFLGAILCRLAANAGARVIAVSRRPFSLELARQYGASQTIVMDDHWRILEEVRMLTDGHGCERVIECVGLQWPLDLATEMTRERGRLIIAGYHQDGPRQVNMQLWNWRGLDVVNAHERANSAYVQGMRDAVQAVVSGALDLGPLLTHTLSLADIAKGYELLTTRPDGFVKAVVMTR
jgi:threonine dehydrogenase-like Zn-dependent dehydrogenase